MATLNATKPGLTPTAVTVHVPSASDVIPNDGKTMLILDNRGGSAGSCTVTIASNLACDQGGDHDIAVALSAGQIQALGPFKKTRFDNASGQVAIAATGTLTGLSAYLVSAAGVA